MDVALAASECLPLDGAREEVPGKAMLEMEQWLVPMESGAMEFIFIQPTRRISINKYVASTGAFVGWIGAIGSTPAGGASGCSSASIGVFTPGWCTGGGAQSGSGDGMVNQPQGIFTDGTYLYVADSQNSRINKYFASSGTFIGWKGGISTSPTGGDAGCTGATAATPGWCTGGTAIYSQGAGEVDTPAGVFADSTYPIYQRHCQQSGRAATEVNRFLRSDSAFGEGEALRLQ